MGWWMSAGDIYRGEFNRVGEDSSGDTVWRGYRPENRTGESDRRIGFVGWGNRTYTFIFVGRGSNKSGHVYKYSCSIPPFPGFGFAAVHPSSRATTRFPCMHRLYVHYTSHDRIPGNAPQSTFYGNGGCNDIHRFYRPRIMRHTPKNVPCVGASANELHKPLSH